MISDSAGKEGLREGQATANYAARKVLEALGNMFGNARSVMDWLNECAKEIAHHGALHPLPWCLRLPSNTRPALRRGFREVAHACRFARGAGERPVLLCAPTLADACLRSRTASAGSAACTPCCRPSLSRASAVLRCASGLTRVVRSYQDIL